MKSGLPLELLGQVWRLVSSGSPSISLQMFIIAMILITKLKMGLLASVPQTIPASLLNQTGTSTPKNDLWDSPSSSSSHAPPSIYDAVQAPKAFTSTISSASIGDNKPSPEDNKKYQSYFENLDTTRKSFLTG
jgi:hypothetical protein